MLSIPGKTLRDTMEDRGGGYLIILGEGLQENLPNNVLEQGLDEVWREQVLEGGHTPERAHAKAPGRKELDMSGHRRLLWLLSCLPLAKTPPLTLAQRPATPSLADPRPSQCSSYHLDISA